MNKDRQTHRQRCMQTVRVLCHPLTHYEGLVAHPFGHRGVRGGHGDACIPHLDMHAIENRKGIVSMYMV